MCVMRGESKANEKARMKPQLHRPRKTAEQKPPRKSYQVKSRLINVLCDAARQVPKRGTGSYRVREARCTSTASISHKLNNKSNRYLDDRLEEYYTQLIILNSVKFAFRHVWEYVEK